MALIGHFKSCDHFQPIRKEESSLSSLESIMEKYYFIQKNRVLTYHCHSNILFTETSIVLNPVSLRVGKQLQFSYPLRIKLVSPLAAQLCSLRDLIKDTVLIITKVSRKGKNRKNEHKSPATEWNQTHVLWSFSSHGCATTADLIHHYWEDSLHTKHDLSRRFNVFVGNDLVVSKKNAIWDPFGQK